MLQCDSENVGDIEIVICNNASTDDTDVLCQDYIHQYPTIVRYICHSKNIGFDGNIEALFSHAKGANVWLLSDDDALNVGAIKKLLDIIKKHPTLKVIFSNYDECDALMNLQAKRIRPEINKDVFCQTGEAFFTENKFLSNLVSSVIINKAAWLTTTVAEKYYNGWHFTAKVAAILAVPPADSYVIADKLVKFRMGNAAWCNDGKYLFIANMRLLDIIYMMREYNYPKHFVDGLIHMMFKSYRALLASVIVRSVKIKDRCDIAKILIKNFWRLPSTWFVLLPELCIPTFAAKLMYRIVRGRSIITHSKPIV